MIARSAGSRLGNAHELRVNARRVHDRQNDEDRIDAAGQYHVAPGRALSGTGLYGHVFGRSPGSAGQAVGCRALAGAGDEQLADEGCDAARSLRIDE